MESYSSNKRVREDESDSTVDSLEAKRVRENLQLILDDTDPDNEVDEGLFEVIKSFEEEISAPSSPAAAPEMVASGSEPCDLGYLLEASDDELGLPPRVEIGGFGGKGRVSVSGSEMEEAELRLGKPGDVFELDGELPNYDAFELGLYDASETGGDGFDYCGDVYDGAEVYDHPWRMGSIL